MHGKYPKFEALGHVEVSLLLVDIMKGMLHST